MNLTDFCMRNPAAVIAGSLFILLLGIYSAMTLPVQLFPDIERPTLSVFTPWRAASPSQVESEITEQVEDVLDGVSGMTEMQSWSNQGASWVGLQFEVGSDMNAVVLDVLEPVLAARLG